MCCSRCDAKSISHNIAYLQQPSSYILFTRQSCTASSHNCITEKRATARKFMRPTQASLTNMYIRPKRYSCRASSRMRQVDLRGREKLTTIPQIPRTNSASDTHDTHFTARAGGPRMDMSMCTMRKRSVPSTLGGNTSVGHGGILTDPGVPSCIAET